MPRLLPSSLLHGDLATVWSDGVVDLLEVEEVFGCLGLGYNVKKNLGELVEELDASWSEHLYLSFQKLGLKV